MEYRLRGSLREKPASNFSLESNYGKIVQEPKIVGSLNRKYCLATYLIMDEIKKKNKGVGKNMSNKGYTIYYTMFFKHLWKT